MNDLLVPAIDPDADTLTAALAYAEAGWYIGYTDPGYHQPKSPEVMGKSWQTKTSRDPQTIVGWYAGRNLGVFLHAGRSGAWIADVDHPEHMPDVLADACTWAPYQSTRPNTPGRGHYLFRQPPGRILGNGVGGLGKGWGEARGRNGVIVVWPTPHPAGGEYRWERVGTVLELPGPVADLLNDTTPAEDAVTDDELTEFLKAHTAADRPELLRAVTVAYTAATAEGESRHDTAVKVSCWAMREAAAGFYPARDAACTLRDLYTEARGHNRDGGRVAVDEASAHTEYRSILAWAIGQVATVDLNELRAKVNGRVPDDVTLIGNSSRPAPDPPEPCNLAEAHTVFRKWLGEEYDLDALNATLATAAAERLGGDALWLLLVSGSGNAKTETVQALRGAGAAVVSTIASDGALLSGTPRQQRAKNATGGLLRQLGDHGLLIIKDVTSILSMDRNTRQAVLAAIREVHDGHWVRYLGTDGGKTLEWSGRIVIIGAVTTAWDRAHDVIASMGDRFLILRMDSTEGRLGAGRQSRRNVNHEEQMRTELSAAVAGVLMSATVDIDTELTEDESERLLAAADLVTLARTGVDFDYRGDVIDAHAPEMPTRFMKQLVQIVRGGVGIGMRRDDALRLAVRCARDSMPPLRLAILDDIAEHPASTPTEVRRRIDKPRATVDRQLQALHILGVAWLDEEERIDGKTTWRYSLAEGIDPTTLRT